jgi:hypothetical protein
MLEALSASCLIVGSRTPPELGFMDRNREVHVERTSRGCWDVSPAALAENWGAAGPLLMALLWRAVRGPNRWRRNPPPTAQRNRGSHQFPPLSLSAACLAASATSLRVYSSIGSPSLYSCTRPARLLSPHHSGGLSNTVKLGNTALTSAADGASTCHQKPPIP